jgi:hypothetical protein
MNVMLRGQSRKLLTRQRKEKQVNGKSRMALWFSAATLQQQLIVQPVQVQKLKCTAQDMLHVTSSHVPQLGAGLACIQACMPLARELRPMDDGRRAMS